VSSPARVQKSSGFEQTNFVCENVLTRKGRCALRAPNDDFFVILQAPKLVRR